MSLKLKIPQATKTGFIEVEPNGAFDFAYPTSLTRRGRVQGGQHKSDNNLRRSSIYLCI